MLANAPDMKKITSTTIWIGNAGDIAEKSYHARIFFPLLRLHSLGVAMFSPIAFREFSGLDFVLSIPTYAESLFLATSAAVP